MRGVETATSTPQASLNSHEVDLVVAGGGDDDVAPLQPRLLERGELAGVGVHPLRLGHGLGLDVGEVALDEHHLVVGLDELGGDRAADRPGPGHGHTHAYSALSGEVAAAAVTLATVPLTAAA
jgi:hypothetical protein